MAELEPPEIDWALGEQVLLIGRVGEHDAFVFRAEGCEDTVTTYHATFLLAQGQSRLSDRTIEGLQAKATEYWRRWYTSLHRKRSP